MIDKIFDGYISQISHIYQTPDLPWNSFTLPLKKYQAFFVKKISEGSPLQRTSWKITKIVFGILVYPTLGFLAATSVLIKTQHIHSLIDYNDYIQESLFKELDSFIEQTTGEGAAQIHLGFTELNTKKNCRYQLLYEMDLDQWNLDAKKKTLKAEIGKCSETYRKVYPKITSASFQEKGHIHVQLYTLENL